MNVDNTTLNDLSIFAHEEELSVFHRLDFARTIGGRDWLKYYVDEPLGSIKQISERQQLLQRIIGVLDEWPVTINNGTIMVIEKYFESGLDAIPKSPDLVSALTYKLFSSADYSLISYTVGHFNSFIKGMHQIKELLWSDENAPELSVILERIHALIKRPLLQKILQQDAQKKLSRSEILTIGHFVKYEFKDQCRDMIELYSKLDAFTAWPQHAGNTVFHSLHLLMRNGHSYLRYNYIIRFCPFPVSYDIVLDAKENFFSYRSQHGR